MLILVIHLCIVDGRVGFLLVESRGRFGVEEAVDLLQYNLPALSSLLLLNDVAAPTSIGVFLMPKRTGDCVNPLLAHLFQGMHDCLLGGWN